jgi:hypothetical protein
MILERDALKAKQFYERAAEARADAEKMADPSARQTLLDIADTYERMALRFAVSDARNRR